MTPYSDAAVSVAPPAPDAGAAATAPIEGYDAFSIPALRGHLRAYPADLGTPVGHRSLRPPPDDGRLQLFEAVMEHFDVLHVEAFP